MYDHSALKIYTDGSAMPNPGPGGIGFVVEFPDGMELDNYEFSEGYKLSTNNRMELLACIKALKWIQGFLIIRGNVSRTIIITDSEYVYNNHDNATYWKNDKWIDRNGKPYENSDLWDEFLKERQKTKTRVDIHWEKGKTREILKKADKLAKLGAKTPLEIDYGFKSGKFTATRTNDKRSATLYIPTGKKEIIRVYRKSIYGKNDNELWKITFDVFDNAQQKYVSKNIAYLKNKTIILERNNCYEVSFDKDSKIPLIARATKVEYKK